MAYHAGKRVQEGRYEDEERDARIDQLEAQQAAAAQPMAAPAPAAPAAGGIPQSTIDQLKQLADLKEQGILSEEEFAQQKQKLLGLS